MFPRRPIGITGSRRRFEESNREPLEAELSLERQPRVVQRLTKALESLEKVAAKARNHEVDQGFFNAMNLKMNTSADPLLEQTQFKEARRRIKG